jgi:hypothetical protein
VRGGEAGGGERPKGGVSDNASATHTYTHTATGVKTGGRWFEAVCLCVLTCCLVCACSSAVKTLPSSSVVGKGEGSADPATPNQTRVAIKKIPRYDSTQYTWLRLHPCIFRTSYEGPTRCRAHRPFWMGPVPEPLCVCVCCVVCSAFDDLVDAKRILREIKLLRHLHHENVRTHTPYNIDHTLDCLYPLIQTTIADTPPSTDPQTPLSPAPPPLPNPLLSSPSVCVWYSNRSSACRTCCPPRRCLLSRTCTSCRTSWRQTCTASSTPSSRSH